MNSFFIQDKTLSSIHPDGNVLYSAPGGPWWAPRCTGSYLPLYTVYGGSTSPAPVHIWVLEKLQHLVQLFDILVKPSDGGTVNRSGSFGWQVLQFPWNKLWPPFQELIPPIPTNSTTCKRSSPRTACRKLITMEETISFYNPKPIRATPGNSIQSLSLLQVAILFSCSHLLCFTLHMIMQCGYRINWLLGGCAYSSDSREICA